MVLCKRQRTLWWSKKYSIRSMLCEPERLPGIMPCHTIKSFVNGFEVVHMAHLKYC